MSFTSEACISCNNTVICKVYDDLKNNRYFDLTMTGCRYYTKSSGNEIVQTQNNESTPERRDVTKDSLSVSAMIHELSGDKDMPHAMPLEEFDGGQCAECGSMENDLFKCSSCGKIVCVECATETMDGRVLCSDCFMNDDFTTI